MNLPRRYVLTVTRPDGEQIVSHQDITQQVFDQARENGMADDPDLYAVCLWENLREGEYAGHDIDIFGIGLDR